MGRLFTFVFPMVSAALVVSPLSGIAQQEVEIIPLQHRFPDDVIPQLRPFVEPGGVLQGANNQLILRASRRNREEIKRLLASLDQPLRRLLIQLSRERQENAEQRNAGVSGTVILGDGTVKIAGPRRVSGGASISLGMAGGSRVTGSLVGECSSDGEHSLQMVQVVEGGQAFIQVGQSIPLPLTQVMVGPAGAVVSQAVVWQDLGQGFYAEPRVTGDRITLEISPQASNPGAYGVGSTRVERLSTTVSGRLGEWIQLGGSIQESHGRGRGNATQSTQDAREGGMLWLKVDELP